MNKQQQNLKENTRLMDKNFPMNIFHNNHAAYTVLGLHWHDNIEIIRMLEGHALFYIGSQPIEALPGDILFVNSGQLHSGYSMDNTHVRYDAIVIHPSLLVNQSPDPYQLKYISPFLKGQMQFPGKICREDIKHRRLQECIHDIVTEFDLKEPGYELTIKSILVLLVLSVYRNCCSNGKERNNYDKYARDTESFKKLVTYIENHYDEKISISEAASIVNLSPNYFCKAFKKVTGRGFVEYINLYRVNIAVELLQSTSLPITEIATKVGFCNINYFDKIFKQYKKYSPSQSRK